MEVSTKKIEYHCEKNYKLQEAGKREQLKTFGEHLPRDDASTAKEWKKITMATAAMARLRRLYISSSIGFQVQALQVYHSLHPTVGLRILDASRGHITRDTGF
ncbi:hypothetical protein DPMN_115185 [Dreissena polymorpha]|uniref:Uncharacterized protein n=1 Tax=Dreissena polymorpha TaxID=45954 RepID=A0A9D4QT54_DREPO|nr:hypothetical protein DPMN_115185 [Dreissena polymorpha]